MFPLKQHKWSEQACLWTLCVTRAEVYCWDAEVASLLQHLAGKEVLYDQYLDVRSQASFCSICLSFSPHLGVCQKDELVASVSE